ncbi:MAG: methyltransferase domain-containing protein [Paracoccaceae bacterium]
MADPFQDVDAAGPEFIKAFADSMDVRQADPTMEAIVAGYLGQLNTPASGRVLEIGAGAGAVSRRIADHFPNADVVGYEPSHGFVDEARARAGDRRNLSFQQADGAALPEQDATADAAVLHTVLSHVVEPKTLVNEATRVLKPGGQLVICDADFSKAAFSSFPNDPLDTCAKEFVRLFVTDPFIVGKLRGLMTDAGLEVVHFDVTSRVVSTLEQMLPWAEMSARQMEERGDIGKGLADALIEEHNRRAEAGTLYGYQAFSTVIAKKG